MTSPDTGDETAKIRYTMMVRRGLKLMADLIRSANVDSLPPIETQIDRMDSALKKDLTRALAWVEQETKR